jgi:hypothetical protein
MTIRHNQLLLGVAILAIAVTVGAASYTKAAEADAENGNPPAMGQHMARFCSGCPMVDPTDEIRDAIKNGDYQAWADLMNERPNAGIVVNEETFAKMQDMHERMQSGDAEGAKAIVDELGMPRFGGRGHGIEDERFQAIRDAVTNGNYDTWAELMAEAPNGQVEISRETFDKYVELQDLTKRANALREELGINGPGSFMVGGPMMRRGGHAFGAQVQE